MNKYREMKEKHQNEVNSFPMVFAFSNKQFEEGMRKLGLEPTDTDKVYKLGGTGGFYRKDDSKALHEMFDRHSKELSEAMQDEEFIFEAFDYELGNHEFIVTGDVTDAVEALGMTVEEVYENPKMLNALKKAVKSQREWYEKHR
jgi:hypothetical protein